MSLLDPRHDLGFLVKMITDEIGRRSNSELSEIGITYQQSWILSLLDSRDGSLSQREIEDAMSVSHPTVVGYVRRLESKGLVTVASEPGCQSKTVRITDDGRAALRLSEESVRRMESRLTDGLSEEERQQLRSLLERMFRNVSER